MIHFTLEFFEKYLTHFPDERNRIAQILEFITSCEKETLIDRKNPWGHFTASAFVFNAIGEYLVIHHNSLNTWLQPGGHIDRSDATLVGAAQREVREETGVTGLIYEPLLLSDPEVPYDIDIHPIPENEKKQEVAHYHFDLRYRFTLPAGEQDFSLQVEEVSAAKFISVEAARKLHPDEYVFTKM